MEPLKHNPSLAETHLHPFTDEKPMHRMKQGLARGTNQTGHPSSLTPNQEISPPSAADRRDLVVTPDLRAYVLAAW